MSNNNDQYLAACRAAKSVNGLVKRHVIRELIKLDGERGVQKRIRVIDKEQEIRVDTIPLPAGPARELTFQVVFEGKVTGPMRDRINACFSGELVAPLVAIISAEPKVGWKKIKTTGANIPIEKSVDKYRVNITKGK